MKYYIDKIVGVILFILIIWVCLAINKCNEKVYAKKDYPTVKIIRTSDVSYYVVDIKYKLCFYHTETSYIATAIQIDCNKFKEFIK